MPAADVSSDLLIDPRIITSGMPPWLGALIAPPLSSLLGLGALNRLHRQVLAKTDPREFCEEVLRLLRVTVRVSVSDVEKIPTSGPLIVAANHPYGGIDGMALLCLMLSRRSDVKALANYLLSKIDVLKPIVVRVDPFGGAASRAANVAGMREAYRWLRQGGALITFPSGTVAHLAARRRAVIEAPWNDHVGRLARLTGAAVLPVHISGRNSALFQLAGLVHPRLRTALLGRELINKRDHRFTIAVGQRIDPPEGEGGLTDAEFTLYVRRRAAAMRHRLSDRPAWRFRRGRWFPSPVVARDCPVADPVDADALSADIAALPEEALLCRSGPLAVFQASAAQLPNVLPELGRLREIAFRAVGEGSGCPRDIDCFDVDYRHLFVWNEQQRELIGAYRLGLTDDILPRQGRRGLYTDSLFVIADEFFERISPAVELGRSFIRPEYQRSPAPLMLLWKGIGQFLARAPRYRYLFGAVSISGAYTQAAKQLMVDFLQRPEYLSPWASLVRSRRPFRDYVKCDPELTALAQSFSDIDQLGDAVADLEPDGKRVPILIRQYLRLGARTLAFSVDPNFKQCLDCFCCFDLLHTQRRDMERYMGREQTRAFLAAHGRWEEGPRRTERAAPSPAVACGADGC